jgi:hypothetical protein
MSPVLGDVVEPTTRSRSSGVRQEVSELKIFRAEWLHLASWRDELSHKLDINLIISFFPTLYGNALWECCLMKSFRILRS